MPNDFAEPYPNEAGSDVPQVKTSLPGYAANPGMLGRSSMIRRQQQNGEIIDTTLAQTTSSQHCRETNDAVCNCGDSLDGKHNSAVKGTLRVAGSTLTGIVVAFFPKCPICWAGYMSLFGAVGLRSIPYTPQTLFLFIAAMAANLYLHYRISRKKHRMGAFVLNLVGVGVTILGYFSGVAFLSYCGPILLVASSLFINLRGDLTRLRIA